MSDAIYRFARWYFGPLGFIPAAEAVRSAKFEAALMMLLPSDEDRERFREGALMLAQAGVTAEQMEAGARELARLGDRIYEEGTE